MLSEQAKEAKREYYRKYKSSISDEAKEARNAYQRQWRRNNPDKLKEYNREYWERKAEQSLSKQGALDRAIQREYVEVPICEPADNDDLKEIIQQQAYRLHDLGCSLRAIGKQLGISHMMASRIIKDRKAL
ncbi:hypothetical protein HXX01_01860 [Candidatus Nomurabacteria bacterium]|nr:hypothetical protein [Candidatus Nomurabacteria bacterium]